MVFAKTVQLPSIRFKVSPSEAHAILIQASWRGLGGPYTLLGPYWEYNMIW